MTYTRVLAIGALMKSLPVVVSVVVLSCAVFVRADATGSNADAEFLSKVVPSIAASVKIIEYEVNNTSDAKIKEFAQRVLNQHKGSVRTATAHAQRLNVPVDTDGTNDSKEMIAALSTRTGADRDVAFLEWLGHIHHDTAVFDDEIRNGTDAELKAYAQASITAGNGHLSEAHELLSTLRKS